MINPETPEYRLSVVGCPLSVRSGIATLPAILGMVILVVALVIGVTALGFSDSIISQGQNQSAKAYTYAQAGAKDALQRLTWDYTFSSSSYSIDFVSSGCANSTGCATITVSTNTGAVGDPKIITSQGQVGSNIRTLRVQVIFDASSTGQIATTTWTEI